MYTDHFGLSGQPFQLTPDARFWFESRTHRKAMAYLGYGLAQGEGFITITGEIGAGKSTLVAHLMATIDRSRLNVISLVSTQVEGDDMLRLVAQGVGLATGAVEKARLLDSLEQRLEAELRSGKRTLLIVDEAQNLPVSALEELRMLSNFQVGGRALIQIFLLGQPEFRDKLASAGLEQLRQRVIATHHLEAMAADEVESYVRHRLGVVGWSGRPGFTPAAFAAIHSETGGIPRKVNQLANRLMLHAALGGEGMIGAETVDSVVADLSADCAPAPAREAVLPLGSAKPPLEIPADAPAVEPVARVAEPEPFVERRRASDAALEREIAALQARAEEQEAMLRRVLTMLVEWVENPEPSFRSHAA